MNLYIISQSITTGYGTYDSVVVCAESAEEAAKIIPGGLECNGETYEWTQKIEAIKVKFIGIAGEGIEAGIILASYNSG